MNSFVPDYKALYKLQDKVLSLLSGHLGSFYLTGGTALGRFYLHHRYSDDLDFFVNNDVHFGEETQRIFQFLKTQVKIDESASLQTTEFVRLWIDEDIRMKIEFVNDTPDRWNETIHFQGLPIDNPANILANKIGALLGRDEAKDLFDIVSLAMNYAFNWKVVFGHAMQKQLMNEADVLMRLASFPGAWLESVPWLKVPMNIHDFMGKLSIVSEDFLLAKDNSLGEGKTGLIEARPIQI